MDSHRVPCPGSGVRRLRCDASAEERNLLRTIATEEEIASWMLEGSYLGYRLGIREDGTWKFFAAGD